MARRYVVVFTPPDGDWVQEPPFGRLRLRWKLRRMWNGKAFWALIAVADREYEREG